MVFPIAVVLLHLEALALEFLIKDNASLGGQDKQYVPITGSCGVKTVRIRGETQPALAVLCPHIAIQA